MTKPKKWIKEQLAEIEAERAKGYGDGYIAWQFGCQESELPPRRPIKYEPAKANKP